MDVVIVETIGIAAAKELGTPEEWRVLDFRLCSPKHDLMRNFASIARQEFTHPNPLSFIWHVQYLRVEALGR